MDRQRLQSVIWVGTKMGSVARSSLDQNAASYKLVQKHCLCCDLLGGINVTFVPPFYRLCHLWFLGNLLFLFPHPRYFAWSASPFLPRLLGRFLGHQSWLCGSHSRLQLRRLLRRPHWAALRALCRNFELRRFSSNWALVWASRNTELSLLNHQQHWMTIMERTKFLLFWFSVLVSCRKGLTDCPRIVG